MLGASFPALAGPVRARIRRRGFASSFALCSYAVISFLYFGLPMLFHAGRTYFGIRNGDAELEIWAFGWWPHAILHGQNPFYTHVVWAPTGVSLAWPTMAPAIAIAFSPLTLLLGPLASFDIAETLMPALAAWTAFLLCRHVTRAFWPSLVGGYLFGFSAYELGQLQGHIQLTAVFLIPLVVLVVLRYVEGELTRRRLALLLGILIGLELLISTEIAFTLTLMLISVFVVAYVFAPELRGRLRAMVSPLIAAYGIAAVVASPLLYFMLTNFQSGRFNPISPAEYSSDLLNFVVPTDLVAASSGWAHGIYSHFTGWETEQGAYIGVPALVILVWFGVQRWRSHATRVLLVSIAVIAFLSFGTWLHVYGKQVVTLPWEHIGYLPLFKNVLTGRFSMYIALGVGLVVAMWAAARETPALARAILPALAVIALLPHLHRSTWSVTTHVPAFITAGIYKSCLRPDDTVLVFPLDFRGNSMLWQAEAGFRFRMASGYVAAIPPKQFRQPAGMAQLALNAELPDYEHVAPVREYVQQKHVTVILVERGPVTTWIQGVPLQVANPWPKLIGKLARPHQVGGLLLYRLDGTAPCRSSTTKQREAASAATGASTASSARSGLNKALGASGRRVKPPVSG